MVNSIVFKMNTITCLCFVFTFVSQSSTARILAVYPVPCMSHQIFFRTLTEELVRRGHELVVITTDPAFPQGGAPENLTEIDVHDISYEKWKKHVWTVPTGRKQGLFPRIAPGIVAMIEIFEDQLKSRQVQELINDKSRTFDLVLLESCIRLPLIFSWIYKVPVIFVSSFGSIYGTFEIVGAPVHASLYSSIMRERTYNCTYWEKTVEIINHYYLNYKYQTYDAAKNEMVRRHFGNDVPTFSELQENVDMFILNMYPEWDLNRPVPRSVVYLGGLHDVPEKTLPKDIKSFLDLSIQGVIYISFGTNIIPSMLPPEKIQIFVNVFSQLPYAVLWKWDKDELPGRSENIRIAKWLPQMEVLRHPNIKLFITQGGLQSTDEAMAAGVSVIGVPMLADQWFNVEKYVHYNFGIMLDIVTITEAVLQEGIETVIANDSYRQNLIKHRSLLHDQPQRPLDRAVWWTEHVLRHGGASHLRAPAANMGWAEYLELELIVISILSLFTLGTGLFFTFYMAMKVLYSNILNIYRKYVSVN